MRLGGGPDARRFAGYAVEPVSEAALRGPTPDWSMLSELELDSLAFCDSLLERDAPAYPPQGFAPSLQPQRRQLGGHATSGAGHGAAASAAAAGPACSSRTAPPQEPSAAGAPWAASQASIHPRQPLALLRPAAPSTQQPTAAAAPANAAPAPPAPCPQHQPAAQRADEAGEAAQQERRLALLQRYWELTAASRQQSLSTGGPPSPWSERDGPAQNSNSSRGQQGPSVPQEGPQRQGSISGGRAQPDVPEAPARGPLSSHLQCKRRCAAVEAPPWQQQQQQQEEEAERGASGRQPPLDRGGWQAAAGPAPPGDAQRPGTLQLARSGSIHSRPQPAQPSFRRLPGAAAAAASGQAAGAGAAVPAAPAPVARRASSADPPGTGAYKRQAQQATKRTSSSDQEKRREAARNTRARKREYVAALEGENTSLRLEVRRLTQTLHAWATQGFITPDQALEFLLSGSDQAGAPGQ